MANTLAVTRLSDGRLQMWGARGSLYSSWQTSLDPEAPWTPLSPFEPSPFSPAAAAHSNAHSVAAGRSPDGRVQLWVVADVSDWDFWGEGRLLSTWKVSGDANAGWTDWQKPFNPDPGANLWTVAVGQLSDGRMQLWVVSVDGRVQSIWKESTEPGAAWTSAPNPVIPFPFWQNPFMPDPGFVFGGVATGLSPDGRVQLWVAGAGPSLKSTWKKSADSSAGWFDWQSPFEPDPGPVFSVGVGQLSDGRLQLWAISTSNRLMTTWKTSADPGAPWVGWQSPFFPDPGFVMDVAVGQLSDGRLQLWAVTPSADPQLLQVSTCQKLSADANAGWTAWQVFGNLFG